MVDKEKRRAVKRRYNERYYKTHLEEELARKKAWRKAHPEEAHASSKAWRKVYPESVRTNNKAWYKAHREKALAQSKAWHEVHREETRISNKKWRKAHPERVRALSIKYKYNFSLNEYNTLLFYQGNVCAICRQPFTKTPAIDHDHKTGKVRGLLCLLCNRGLGSFKDDSCRLRLAVEYLEKKKGEGELG